MIATINTAQARVEIPYNRVKQIYFGRKPGCMCGCNGKYYDIDKRSWNRAAKILAGITTDKLVEFESSGTYIYVQYRNEYDVKKVLCFYKN